MSARQTKPRQGVQVARPDGRTCPPSALGLRRQPVPPRYRDRLLATGDRSIVGHRKDPGERNASPRDAADLLVLCDRNGKVQGPAQCPVGGDPVLLAHL
jgi:hypothetical protein